MTLKAVMKQVTRVVPPRRLHWVGNGLPVHNIIDYDTTGQVLNPFIMLDYGAPYKFNSSQQPRGVPMHPHRGIETVTMVFQGEITHRDSAGNSDTIRTGDVQWMTAGRGIEHSEMHSQSFTRSGGTLEMLQLWVNLPASDKMTTPKYHSITADNIPTVQMGQQNVKVIAGSFHDVVGPASTFTPLNLWIVKLPRGGNLSFQVPDGWNSAVFCVKGKTQSGTEVCPSQALIIYSRKGTQVEISALEDSVLLVMSGEPITEPLVAKGSMVMNSKSELRRALWDYLKGEFK